MKKYKNFFLSKKNGITIISVNKFTPINLINNKNNIHQGMNIFWEERMSKILERDDFPFLIMSFQRNNREWEWFCERDSLKLGICNKNPFSKFVTELKKLIFIFKLKNKNKIISFHLNLSIYSFKLFTHANTIIIDLSKKRIYIYDPLGTINNLVPGFSYFFLETWRKISRKLNLEFSGYFTPNLNFQIYDYLLCGYWTSWMEILIVLNANISIDKFKKFIQKRYSYNLINPQYDIQVIGAFLKELAS